MAEQQKPLTLAPETVAPVTNDSTTAPVTTATETSAPAIADAKTEEEPVNAEETTASNEEVKPIYEGTLTYSPSGNPFTSLFSKKAYHFYFGEEPVASDKLSHLLKPGKADLKETVAWSHETGKGLLYFTKHADHKDSPKGVIALADVEDLKILGITEISFKLHGHKHVLGADTPTNQKGWKLALDEKVEEAKALKEEVHGKEGFKETLDKLAKPVVPAAVAAKTTETSPKKSSDSKSVERAARSSEATDKPRPTVKDRSQSRSKSFFSKLSGKPTKEETKAEDTPVVPSSEPAVEPTAVAATGPAPVSDEIKPTESAVEEPKTEDVKDTKKVKEGRRSSKIFDFFATPQNKKKTDDVVSSPTEAVEKSEAAAAPATEAPVIVEPAKASEPVIVAAEEPATTNGETKTTEEINTPTTGPKEEKRRSSFFGGLAGTLRKASRTEEKKPKALQDEAKATEENKAGESAIEEPKVAEPKPEESVKVVEPEVVAPEAATDVTEPTVTKEPIKEPASKKENKLVAGIQRSLSKLRKPSEPKEKKVKPTTEKLEEQPTEETKATDIPATSASPELTKVEEKDTPAAPNAIGDVVPEAIHTGAPPAHPTVSATA